jgi:threonine/homoserine/homoserine lactone efflux protein
MALTIATLTFLYGLIVTLLTHRLAERLRASPKVSRLFSQAAGVFMIGFGVKLALSR